jgi:hypothetical protein
MPFHNMGNRRFFLYSEVHAWIMNSPKVIHSRHRRRTKAEVAAVQDAKKKKVVGPPGLEPGTNRL